MKKIITMVAVLMSMATTNASNKNTDSISKAPEKMEAFSKVNINVPARVKLVSSEEYGIMVNTASAFDATKLDYEVRNGILYISTECGDMLSGSGRGTSIIIYTPEVHTDVTLGDDVVLRRKKK
jgi:hypothetical protein